MGKEFGFDRHGVELAAVLNRMVDSWHANKGLGVEALAASLKRSPEWAYKVLECKLHFHADLIGPLTKITGNTDLIEAICRQAGGSFVPNPRHCILRESTLRPSLKAAADAADAYLQALEDGSITEEEANSLVLPTLEKAVGAFHRLMESVKRNAGRVPLETTEVRRARM